MSCIRSGLRYESRWYTSNVDFVWDARKNESNIAKHGLDFADARHVFDAPLLVALDERDDYGEDRWIGIGFLDGRVVVIVFTGPDENSIRVISLRKALRHERERFGAYLEDGLGAG